VLERQIDQHERRATLENDRKVREGTAYIDHYTQEMGGRFAAVGAATVIGSTAVPQYPAASAPFQRDPVPNEEPLGYEIDALPELEPSHLAEAQATGPASDDPSPLGQRDVGLSFSDDPITEGLAPSLASPRAQRGGVGSSPFRRRV
jgi:hypothetical protein